MRNRTYRLWPQALQATSDPRRTLLLLCASVLVSVILVTSMMQHITLQHIPSLVIGLIASVTISSATFLMLGSLLVAFDACDATFRRMTLSLIASGIVLANTFMPIPTPRTLTWRWDAGPQAGAPAPIASAASWDDIERSVVELHATNAPPATPFGVWRALASLDEIAGMQPAQVELWLTQPSWAVIDPATNNPGPNVDGVDVTISVQRGQETLLERRVALDPPAIPEQRAWHHVVLNLPPDSERLVVDVLMRKTLDSDRVWVTEAVARPVWNSALDRVAITLIVVLAGSTLLFAGSIPTIIRVAGRLSLFLSSYGWLLIGAACLWLAYLLVWQRGLYLDDYSLKSIAVNLITDERKPIVDFRSNPNFPARLFTWIVLPQIAALVPEYELIARILMALFTGINALLLGRLIYEMLDSRIAGIIAGWGFLVHPHNEVPFWIGAGGYLLATMLTLVSLIALWRSMGHSKRPYLWILTSVIALLFSYTFSENGVAMLILPPMFALVAILRQPRAMWRLLGRTIGIMAGLLVANVIYLIVIANNSAVIQNRAGLDLNPGGCIGVRSAMCKVSNGTL